jgi:hypothetical protein
MKEVNCVLAVPAAWQHFSRQVAQQVADDKINA